MSGPIARYISSPPRRVPAVGQVLDLKPGDVMYVDRPMLSSPLSMQPLVRRAAITGGGIVDVREGSDRCHPPRHLPPAVATLEPVPALDGTPGVCVCGLPLRARNARHQVDLGALAEAGAILRQRAGERDQQLVLL